MTQSRQSQVSLSDMPHYTDICAYAIMSNHYHLVLHINEPDKF